MSLRNPERQTIGSYLTRAEWKRGEDIPVAKLRNVNTTRRRLQGVKSGRGERTGQEKRRNKIEKNVESLTRITQVHRLCVSGGDTGPRRDEESVYKIIKMLILTGQTLKPSDSTYN